MDPEIEKRLIADHPEVASDRGKVAFWNFLPPDELNRLLSLYSTVTRKTLLISETMGIEGRKLLTPEDEYDALKEFNAGDYGQKALPIRYAIYASHVILGTLLSLQNVEYYLQAKWLWAKLLGVLVLVGCHLQCGRYVRAIGNSSDDHTHVFFRFFNEIPVVFLFGIVILAVLKPF
jgi:hypothetical protein